MDASPIVIRVFAAPMAACSAGQTWASVAAALGERLRRRFGDGVTVEFVELFSPRSFDFRAVLSRIEAGASLPLVRSATTSSAKAGNCRSRASAVR